VFHNTRGISQLSERVEAVEKICSRELTGHAISAPWSVSCHICSMDCVVPYLLYRVCRAISAPFSSLAMPYLLHLVHWPCHICSMECVVPCLPCRVCCTLSAPFSFLAIPYLLHGVCRAISAPWSVSCHVCSIECIVPYLLHVVAWRAISAPGSVLTMPYLFHGECRAISAPWRMSCHICSMEGVVPYLLHGGCRAISTPQSSLASHVCSREYPGHAISTPWSLLNTL